MAIDEAARAFRQRSTGIAAGIERPVAAVTRFSTGDKLANRYRIIRFIARGGMGEVYEAEDQILGTRVAVKTVAATISDDPTATRRLKQEVNLARRITHPNVCRIFDLGVHQPAPSGRGQAFCSSPWSWSPAPAWRSGCATAGVDHRGGACPLFRRWLDAVGAAHRAGVVHRDFKTDNVLLAPGEGGGIRVVVMDFGLARGLAPSTHDSMENRGLAGTLAYMAPEQLVGRKPAGRRYLRARRCDLRGVDRPFAFSARAGRAAPGRRAESPHGDRAAAAIGPAEDRCALERRGGALPRAPTGTTSHVGRRRGARPCRGGERRGGVVGRQRRESDGPGRVGGQLTVRLAVGRDHRGRLRGVGGRGDGRRPPSPRGARHGNLDARSRVEWAFPGSRARRGDSTAGCSRAAGRHRAATRGSGRRRRRSGSR